MYSIFEMLLERDGVTVAEVSRATGISQSTFSNWKTRNNYLSAKNAQKVADYFGVSVDFLMGKVTDEKTQDYFTDAQSAFIAQQMFDDPQIRGLHHIKSNINSDRFKAYYEMILKLYQQENPTDSYDFTDGKPTE